MLLQLCAKATEAAKVVLTEFLLNISKCYKRSSHSHTKSYIYAVLRKLSVQLHVSVIYGKELHCS